MGVSARGAVTRGMVARGVVALGDRVRRGGRRHDGGRGDGAEQGDEAAQAVKNQGRKRGEHGIPAGLVGQAGAEVVQVHGEAGLGGGSI